MRAIKSQNTRPEILIRKGLHAAGFRYRLHAKDLPGKPDMVLPKYKALIFINGCFWHGHRCHLSHIPKTRTEFWLAKISANMNRDVLTHQRLMKTDWRIALIWECAIRGKTKLGIQFLIDELEKWLLEPESKTIEFSGEIHKSQNENA